MVRKISQEEFKDVLASKVALVDFSAVWCGPCKMVAPVIEALSDELDGQVDFFNVDVDDCPEIAAEYAIMSIPALILFKDGKSVDMKVGFRPQAELAAWIKGELN